MPLIAICLTTCLTLEIFLFLYCLYKRTMLLNVAMPGSAATIKNKALNKTDNIILYLQHKGPTIQQ